MRHATLRRILQSANPISERAVEEMHLADAEEALVSSITAGEAKLRSDLGASEPPFAPQRKVIRRLAPALLVLLLGVAASVATPPGRAVTSWVGERIGLGDPGGEPSLRQLRAFAAKDYDSNRSRVLAVGPAPRLVGRAAKGRYEFIVSWPKGRHAPQGPCFELDLTQVRSTGTEGCGVLPGNLDLYFLGPGGNSDPDFNSIWITGRTSMRVSSAEADLGGRNIPLEFKPIPLYLTRHFHLPRFKFFIGFAPYPRQGRRAEVTVRGANGRPIESQGAQVIGSVPLAVSNCAFLLSASADPNRFAQQDCRQALGKNWRLRAKSSPFYRPKRIP
jgi:hypothetical protein